MFTWILIALALAFIFGVIKVETVKNLAKKYEPKARELFNKSKTFVESKASEIKKNIESKSASVSAPKTEEKETAETQEPKE